MDEVQLFIILIANNRKYPLMLENAVSIEAIEVLNFLIGFVNNCPYIITANRVPNPISPTDKK